ncbi:MAG: [protein-PII] uridylyltransferase [Rhodospirillaceae bacterium]|jgi:[protein-PII] uridylyltransferase|nr:[protein-PII] uridylyltransferase [Rhodospirillaceae bacterium]MBT5665451.1 [protein-PII] uridylyltransferase [Rhodospirillaceae bacterium]
METLRKKRKIIDRTALMEAAHEAVDQGGSDPNAGLLDCFRDALRAGEAEVRSRFEADKDGALAVQGQCYLMDQLIRAIHDIAAERIYRASNPTSGEQLCIVAYGGYGRGELAPKSDLDLLFLLPYKQTPRGEQIVEHMLYMLWDLGLKVGHATRSVEECVRQAKADITIRTGLLECRYVWGEQSLFLELRQEFWDNVAAGTESDFVEAKLHERDERHKRMGDSRYVLEPNIKEGKGGARDLQTLYWIGKYLYRLKDVAELIDKGVLTKAEVALFDKAQKFLWSVRCHLHYLTGRPEERLTFDVQPELASRMGYTDHVGTSGVERFMKHYFLIAKDVGDLTRIFCAALEASQHRRFSLSRLTLWRRDFEGFPIEGGWLNVASKSTFADQPINMLRLFEAAQRAELDIHPNALQLVTRSLRRINRTLRDDADANAIFMRVLTANPDPETTLRRMNEAGVLGRFLPDFGRVVAQMQYDMYHVYTTDEHTIRAIGILNQIERGELTDELPVSSKIISKVLSREVLYAAVLLHDIAKGRGGDHSILGAKMAIKICPRLGFTAEQTDTIAWLVRHHLVMSDTAFKRDLDDPKTIEDFVALVQSPERLRLLLCLTAADIRAVGPGRWNNWKATLLREIYYRSEALMSGGMAVEKIDDRVAYAHETLSARLSDWPQQAIEDHLGRGRPSYWLAYDVDAQRRHADIVRDAEESGSSLAMDARVDPDRAITELTIYSSDHPGMFHGIAGAIALSGATVVDARINTMTNGMALDTISIQDAEGQAVDNSRNLERLKHRIEEALRGQLRVAAEIGKRPPMSKRERLFSVAPRVLIDNKASNTNTVIEVNGRDRAGLLYDVTGALFDLGLQISSAKISTFGEEVVDVFYVKDVFGMKIDHVEKLKQIRESLLDALRDPESRDAEAKGAVAAAE